MLLPHGVFTRVNNSKSTGYQLILSSHLNLGTSVIFTCGLSDNETVPRTTLQGVYFIFYILYILPLHVSALVDHLQDTNYCNSLR
jgi:hypothetical protein